MCTPLRLFRCFFSPVSILNITFLKYENRDFACPGAAIIIRRRPFIGVGRDLRRFSPFRARDNNTTAADE